MRRITISLITVALAVAACSSDGDNDDAPEATDAVVTDSGDDAEGASGVAEPPEPPSGLPADCVSPPFELSVSLDAVEDYSGAVSIDGAAGVATPIVPNGDGSRDQLTPEEFEALGADSTILAYAQWVGNHPFGLDDIGWLGGPDTPDGKVTLALSVTATSADGLAAGDVVDDSDEFDYDSITTLASVGVFYQPDDAVETWFLVDNLDETQGGTAEVLYVDDDWLCVDWHLAGETRDPDGRYEIAGVVLTPLKRLEIPLT